MRKEKRRYDPEFKATVAFEAIKGKFSVGELSEKYDLHPSLIHSWRKKIMESAYQLMSQGHEEDYEVREKEKEIERLSRENEFLQKVAQRMPVAERRDAVETNHPDLPLLRQVKLLNINRSGVYYRAKHTRTQDDEAETQIGTHDGIALPAMNDMPMAAAAPQSQPAASYQL